MRIADRLAHVSVALSNKFYGNCFTTEDTETTEDTKNSLRSVLSVSSVFSVLSRK